MDTTYVDKFLSLRCAPDVLSICSPVTRAAKEITEAYAAVRRIRKIVLDKEPFTYNLIDIGAGNALGSVLAAHLLPISHTVAVDKKYRERRWDKVQRFSYLNITVSPSTYIPGLHNDGRDIILMGIHTCSTLAVDIVNFYKEFPQIKHLVLIPCCIYPPYIEGTMSLLRDRLSKYEQWAFALASVAKGNAVVDKHILSPKNIVITASKKI